MAFVSALPQSEVKIEEKAADTEKVDMKTNSSTDDEETASTDHGCVSSSDDTVSMDKEAPATPPSGGGASASRRSALREMGQEVLTHITKSSPKKEQRTKRHVQPCSQPPVMLASCPKKPHMVPQAAGTALPFSTVAAIVADALKAPPVPASWADCKENRGMHLELQNSNQESNVAEQLPKDEPMKVQGVTCVGKEEASRPRTSLNNMLPVKKRPIFPESPTNAREFNPYMPLKKRVPEFLFEEPTRVLMWNDFANVF
jgi:hypothetical protein